MWPISGEELVLHSGRLTWNLKMMVWKMIFLFNWVIFRFHVNLPGCTPPGVYCWSFTCTSPKNPTSILKMDPVRRSRRFSANLENHQIYRWTVCSILGDVGAFENMNAWLGRLRIPLWESNRGGGVICFIIRIQGSISNQPGIGWTLSLCFACGFFMFIMTNAMNPASMLHFC